MKAESKTASTTLMLSTNFCHLAGKDWGTGGLESFVSTPSQRQGRIFKQRNIANKKYFKMSTKIHQEMRHLGRDREYLQGIQADRYGKPV